MRHQVRLARLRAGGRLAQPSQGGLDRTRIALLPRTCQPGKVALLMAALPTAANAFVLAKQFDIAVEQNSASVLLSTAFSVVTVSALLVLLRVS